MNKFVCPKCGESNPICSDTLSLDHDGSIREYFYAYCQKCYYCSIYCDSVFELENEITYDKLEEVNKFKKLRSD